MTKNKKIVLKFRTVNRDVFDAIVSGRKTIETRAATDKYRGVKVGDRLALACGKQKTEKKVERVEYFKTIGSQFLKNTNRRRLIQKLIQLKKRGRCGTASQDIKRK